MLEGRKKGHKREGSALTVMRVGSEAPDLPDPFIPDSLFWSFQLRRLGPCCLTLEAKSTGGQATGSSVLQNQPEGAGWEGLGEKSQKKCH